ncbi:uncharacterized protein TrAtP1_011226 [Trichoderma atroviride]|uniref:uncharacterized protein n=1 Tax=Hypocrea atroviridis TaxID=63577 RepID=UPI00331D97CC|nr:hypothetical protein TrAtP1_011226 [Trichoderma atroviride]
MTAMWASPAFPAFGLFALAFSSDSSHVPTSQVRQGHSQGPSQRGRAPAAATVGISASRSRDYCWSIFEIFFLTTGLDRHRSIQSPMGAG